MGNPEISVVICTRNRGASIVDTLESVFANHHPSYEVIVVDQSTNDETKAAVAQFEKDPRFRYIHSDTIGTGRSRNIGLRAARGDIVAYTDDDCTVPVDWLDVLQDGFNVDPYVAVVFCSVIAGAHDSNQGYVPTYIIKKNRLAQSIDDVLKGIGLGAGMAVSRPVLINIGGFDDNLGPGSRFKAGEDHDIAIRVLLRKYKVFDVNATSVVHYGFRTWKEGRQHTRRDWFSGGVTYIKPLKCGYPAGTKMLFSKPVIDGLIEPVRDIFSFRRPRGLLRFFYIIEGIVAGLLTPVDREKILYRQ